MINRTEVEVGLQLSVGTFYFSNQIVIIPCSLLIYVPYIGAKEIYTTVLVYVLWYGYAPSDVLHVLRLILVTLIFYHVIFGDGRVLSSLYLMAVIWYLCLFYFKSAKNKYIFSNQSLFNTIKTIALVGIAIKKHK